MASPQTGKLITKYGDNVNSEPNYHLPVWTYYQTQINMVCGEKKKQDMFWTSLLERQKQNDIVFLSLICCLFIFCLFVFLSVCLADQISEGFQVSKVTLCVQLLLEVGSK